MYLSSKKIFSAAANEVDGDEFMKPRWADCGDESETEETYSGTPSSTSASSECGGTDDTETSRCVTADENLVFGDSREVFEESFKAQDAKWQNEPERFAVQPQPVFCGLPMPLTSHLCGLPFVPQPCAFEFMVMPLLDTPVQAIPQVLPSTSPCSEVASPCMSCRGSFGPADNVTLVEEPGQQNSDNAARTCKHGKLVCNFKERELATHGKKKCQCREKGGEEVWKKFCHFDECVRLWHKEKTAIREKANEHKAMQEAYKTSAPRRNAPQRAGPKQTGGASWQGRGTWGQRW
mmetsp:Transcript_71880/g.164831  ORF Transcript_71880/g.164831 Transcript_71880/m.164831 type:complete len:292 (+) Transcript_71880:83-958(+)